MEATEARVETLEKLLVASNQRIAELESDFLSISALLERREPPKGVDDTMPSSDDLVASSPAYDECSPVAFQDTFICNEEEEDGCSSPVPSLETSCTAREVGGCLRVPSTETTCTEVEDDGFPPVFEEAEVVDEEETLVDEEETLVDEEETLGEDEIVVDEEEKGPRDLADNVGMIVAAEVVDLCIDQLFRADNFHDTMLEAQVCYKLRQFLFSVYKLSNNSCRGLSRPLFLPSMIRSYGIFSPTPSLIYLR